MAKVNSEFKGAFNWRVPTAVPAFVQGKEASILYKMVSNIVKDGLWYDEDTQMLRGSNVPISARIDSIVRPLGIRVATLADLSRPEVMGMMQGNYYSDTPELVLRSVEDSYEPNLPIIQRVVQEVETREGKLKLPLKVSGFDVVPSEDKGYGWTVAPRKDFAIVHDERFDAKYHGKTFNDVDAQGIPLFNKDGKRTFYARNQGISRLYLSRNLYIYSNIGGLSGSDEDGRVVLISGEAAGANLREQYASRLQGEVEKRKSELEKWFNDSMARMPRGK